MLKSILLLLGFLFLFVVKGQEIETQSNSNNADLLKSFTASCKTANTCTYSAVLLSTNSSVSYTADVVVTVGSMEQPAVTVNVDYINPGLVNFEVKDKTPISVNFTIQPPTEYDVQFLIFNQADGDGDLILDSQSLQFLVMNPCTGTGCTLQFGRSATDWPTTLSAILKINDVVTRILNSTNPISYIVTFSDSDLLSMEISGDTTNLPDGLRAGILFNGAPIIQWFSNGYFTPMVFPGICAPQPIPTPSPFGGPLVPLTQEEINAFSTSIGTSFSTLWYRETENTL